MMAGQEWDPNIFLKMVIIAGGPAQTPTIELATYKKIKMKSSSFYWSPKQEIMASLVINKKYKWTLFPTYL